VSVIRLAHTSSTQGELGPFLNGRYDLDIYKKGLETAENVLLLPHGGVMRTPGKEYIATVSDPNTAIYSFNFNNEQEYLLVFENQQLTIFKDKILVWSNLLVRQKGTANATYTSGQTIIINTVSVTLSTGTTIDDAVIDINNASIPNVNALKTSDNKLAIDNNFTGNDLTLAEGTGTALADLGLSAGTFTKPVLPIWLIADVATLQFTQDKDIAIITHRNYKPQILTRNGDHDEWTLSDFTFNTFPYFRYFDTDQITLNPNNNTIAGTVTASTALFTSAWNGKQIIFSTTRGGGIIKINDGSLTSTPSTTAAYDIPIKDLTGSGADDLWKEQLWSNDRGWPHTTTKFQSRLFMGGSIQRPMTFAASKVDEIFEFDDTDTTMKAFGFNRTLSTQQVHKILHIASENNLLIFTTQGEFEITSTNAALAPDDIQANPRTQFGSADIPLATIDNEILFITRNLKELRAYTFDERSNKFIGKQYTIIAHHLLNPTDNKIPLDTAFLRAFRDTQSNFVFIPRSDGELLTLTVNVEKSVLGWSRQKTNGSYKNVTVVSTDHGDGNSIETLYMVVQRANGTFIEALTHTDIYLDSYLLGTNATPKTTWSGASTLKNQLVDATIDAFDDTAIVHSTLTVANDGTFITDRATTKVAIGLNYVSTIKTMPFALILGGQVGRGLPIRMVKAEVNMFETQALTANGKTMKFRTFDTTSTLDTPIPPLTGTKEIFISGVTQDPAITLTIDKPVKAIVLSALIEVEVEITG